MKIGDRVKPSAAALRTLRDAWQAEGRSDMKARRKRWYDEKKEQRGEITDIRRNQFTPRYYVIQWDDGSVSETATHMVCPVDTDI